MNDKGLGQFKEQVSHLKDVIGGGYPKFWTFSVKEGISKGVKEVE